MESKLKCTYVHIWRHKVSVVQKFLAAWRRGGSRRVTAFGHGRFSAQRLENAGMRRALRMGAASGVLVKSVEPLTANAGALRVGDVLLSMERVAIGNDGCVPFSGQDRVPFPYLAIDRFVGDQVEAEILREGIRQQVVLKLLACEPLVSASSPLKTPISDEDHRIFMHFPSNNIKPSLLETAHNALMCCAALCG